MNINELFPYKGLVGQGNSKEEALSEWVYHACQSGRVLPEALMNFEVCNLGRCPHVRSFLKAGTWAGETSIRNLSDMQSLQFMG